MNKMSCRFRQNSCAKWKGKKEAFAKKKYVISGGKKEGEEEKKNRIYAQISRFCTKKKKSGI